MMNVINGITLEAAANCIIDADTVGKPFFIQDKDIVFCKTDYLGTLFSALNNYPGSIILVSHFSDYAVTKEMFDMRPQCIKYWFAQNADYSHPNLVPLPIGLENHIGANHGAYTDFEFVAQLPPIELPPKITDKLYCNFSLNTHPNRGNVLQFLKTNGLAFEATRKPYRAYWEEAQSYLFMVSPRGNGIDCHRTWEALLMGSIPIVERHPMYDTFTPLPIVQVDSWNDLLKPDFLTPYVKAYMAGELFKNVEKLYPQYWLDAMRKAQQSL